MIFIKTQVQQDAPIQDQYCPLLNDKIMIFVKTQAQQDAPIQDQYCPLLNDKLRTKAIDL
jgi:hypothetical protein